MNITSLEDFYTPLAKKEYDIIKKYKPRNPNEYDGRFLSKSGIDDTYQATPIRRFLPSIKALDELLLETGKELTNDSNTSLVDLGSGLGLAMMLWKFYKGWDVFGVEGDESLVKASRFEFNLKIEFGNILQPKQYSTDIIYMFNPMFDHKKELVDTVIKNMRSGQILIESYDFKHLVLTKAEEFNYQYKAIEESIAILKIGEEYEQEK